MSRTQQDQFIDDDEEETCPLCVEEFDLGDRNFRPCPCGYQICQFCYNNVRNNMNGLCPACRRPYDDSSIDFKKPSIEEEAAWKAKQAARAKKTVAAQQKELQKKEADSLSRKHLAGLRVVQKNLVYVTGLSPSIQEDKLLETLRGPQYFGQYGKIVKIVVSKAKDHSHPTSVGVYVTYARKEDAASCIEAVDGSQNGERELRAQFGTTKYCSAYIRGEPCQNRNCMFLHEPGEERDSFTRQDLSSMNVISTQQPSQPLGPSHPPPQTQQPMAAAHVLTRQDTGTLSQTLSDPQGPALPSTASWASKPQPSRTASRAATGASASPAPTVATPAEPSVDSLQPAQPIETSKPPELTQPKPPSPAPERPRAFASAPAPSPFVRFVKALNSPEIKFVFSTSAFSAEELEAIKSFPPLFDENGGLKRRAVRLREEEERRRLEQEERNAVQAVSAADLEEQLERSGSLQLGGEPEDRGETAQGQQHAIHPPPNHGLDAAFSLDSDMSNLSLASRGLTPQQQQALLLQQFKTPSSQDSNPLTSASQHQQGPPFQGHASQSGNPPGHARNTSRYTFANDTSSASAAVKPVANSKIMSQQSSMMPSQNVGAFAGQQQPFYTSTVSGPPPGLKTTGTPPVSGGGMFGQGHGFATSGLGYGANLTGRNSNDEMMRELLRRRDVGGQDAGKLDVADPSILQARLHQGNAAGGQGLYGGQGQVSADPFAQGDVKVPSAFSIDESRRATPPVPPGLEGLGQIAAFHSQESSRRATPIIPPGFQPQYQHPIGSEQTPSRPASRSSLKRAPSTITPAVPVLPATPTRVSTPLRQGSKPNLTTGVDQATPDKIATPKIETVRPLTDSKHNEENATPSEVVADHAKTPSKKPETTLPQTPQVRASTKAESTAQPTPVSKDVSKNSYESAIQDKASSAENSLASRSQEKSSSVAQPQQTPSAVASKANGKQKVAQREPITKKAPGTLDIGAALSQKAESQAVSSKSETPTKAPWAVPSALSRPASPSVSVDGTTKKTAPRTLRVVPTPRTETPPPLPSITPALSALTNIKAPSRNPSIASVQPPGTPSSEHVSDTISVTSASVSRASSPPLFPGGRVGTAPVRAKTKSQQKKDRQERAKILEEEKKQADEAASPSVDEPAVEAITSRKKKSKKPSSAPKPKPTASTAPTRPASPEEKSVPAMEAQPSPVRLPEPEVIEEPKQEMQVESPVVHDSFTPASLLTELRNTSSLLSSCLDTFFRPLAQANTAYKQSQAISSTDLAVGRSLKRNPDVGIMPEQVRSMLVGQHPVRYGGEEKRIWSRGCVSPGGAHLRHLEKELEDRYLELEQELRKMPEELRFHPVLDPKSHAGSVYTEFPRIDLEGIKRMFDTGEFQSREANAMEKAVEEGSKKGSFLVGHAEHYINEFVMPVSPANSAGKAGNASKDVAIPLEEGAFNRTTSDGARSLDELERMLTDAKKVMEDREGQLRKLIKKNRKMMGYTH